jgi:hypothetical protein
LKKPIGSVRFRFYKPKTEQNPNRKTEKKSSQTRKKPRQTEPKPSQTEKTKPNRFEPIFILKNQTIPKPVNLNQFQF